MVKMYQTISRSCLVWKYHLGECKFCITKLVGVSMDKLIKLLCVMLTFMVVACDFDSTIGFPLIVDRLQSISQMLAAGKYDGYLSDDLIAERFTVEGSSKSLTMALLVHFDRDDPPVYMDEVLHRVEERGLRVGKIEELLALGAQYPWLQRKCSIIALGSATSCVWVKWGEESPEDKLFLYLLAMVDLNQSVSVSTCSCFPFLSTPATMEQSMYYSSDRFVGLRQLGYCRDRDEPALLMRRVCFLAFRK